MIIFKKNIVREKSNKEKFNSDLLISITWIQISKTTLPPVPNGTFGWACHKKAEIGRTTNPGGGMENFR